MASKMMGKSITEVIHATAKGLHNAGVMNEQTMWDFNESGHHDIVFNIACY